MYLKDEDWRYSFLHGNYVTLSSTTKAELDKIAQYGYSPLFISVHATVPQVRRYMLGCPGAPDILGQLRYLATNNICFHTQIVVCPGINDGKVLDKTISSLLKLGEALLSIAVVPVGLTRYHRNKLTPVSAESAAKICLQMKQISNKDMASVGYRRLFLADEFFIKASVKIPSKRYYENFPQLENGVGIVRQFYEQWKKIRRRIQANPDRFRNDASRRNGTTFIIVTSVSAYAFVARVLNEINTLLEVTSRCIAVKNDFFGHSVTVAGLLTATDIINSIRSIKGKSAKVLIPSVVFNYNKVSLDGYTADDIARETGRSVVVVDSVDEMVRAIL